MTTVLVARVACILIVLAVAARYGAIEGAVADSCPAVVAYESAYVGIVILHVARHAAVFHRSIILTGDTAHLGSERRP